MEAHKAQENEEETEDRGDAYIQEVYTLRDIKGSSTGKRIDRKIHILRESIFILSYISVTWKVNIPAFTCICAST